MNKLLWLLPALLLPNTLWANGNTGGMDGGGGGTLPAQPASVYQIEDVAKESKPELLYLLNGYEVRNRFEGSKPLYQKLFAGTRKAQDVLKDLRLEVRANAPCFTSDSREVDASMHAKKPNTICLSAFRISQKLDKALVEREVLALLLHEVSHFLGATEEEATELQRDIAWTIDFAKGDVFLDGDELREEITQFEVRLTSAIEALEKADLVLANKKLSEAQGLLSRWEGRATKFASKMFGMREAQYQDLLRLRLIWARNYLRTLVPGAQPEASEEYDRVFAGREYFVAHEEGWTDTHHYRDEKVFRLHSVSELRSLLAQTYQEYSLRSAYVYQVTFGMRWLKLDGHLTVPAKNPWEDFVGRYVVESAQCDSGTREEIEFTVESSNGFLYFGRKFPSAYSADGIELGRYNLNAYLNSYGMTDEGEVYMVHEHGGAWSQRIFAESYVNEIRLKKDASGRFELKRTITVQPRDVSKPDQIETCVFRGLVQ